MHVASVDHPVEELATFERRAEAVARRRCAHVASDDEPIPFDG
jgi:hypothetical protein